MTAMGSTPPGSPAPSGAQPTVRRIIVFGILFALVIVGATGLDGLVGRLLDTGTVLAGGDTAGLAQSLASTLIGGPAAAILWWITWRRLADRAERASIAWALYLSLMYAVSLITFTAALLLAATAGVDGTWEPRTLSTGVVWLAVWIWHLWMARHSSKSPTQLVSLPSVLGWVYGLAIGIGGAVTALQFLIGAAIDSAAGGASVGAPWWIPAIQSLLWAVGGAVVWWWHWLHGNDRTARSALTSVAVVVAGILAASILTLGGIGATIFVALRLAFDRTDPITELLSPLDTAIASAAIGAAVWAYHRTITRSGSGATREGARLVTSGVALVATAIGVGVTVNATLAALTPALVGSDARTLLLGGISALIVGGPLWWLVWQPGVRAEASRAASIGRRVYLVSVFGLSAIVAIITLLVIGFRVFEYLLGDVTGESLVDRIRAPLGLLVATGLVAGYHFSVWLRDRAAIAEVSPTRFRTIGHVWLVTGQEADAAAQAHAIDALTGAKVTVWLRADRPDDAQLPGPDDEAIAHALDGIAAQKVLVLVGPGDRIEVIPLES